MKRNSPAVGHARVHVSRVLWHARVGCVYRAARRAARPAWARTWHMFSPAVRTLLRAGLTSGSIMSVSDVLAQLISGAFRKQEEEGKEAYPYDLARTAKYFWLGLTVDGPFWETAFGVMEQIFGAVEGPAGKVRWRVLAGKTIATQFVCNPVFLVLFISCTAVLEGPWTLQNITDNLKVKLWSYLRDGFVWWSFCNALCYRFVPPSLRLLASGIAGLCWSTYFSFRTCILDRKLQHGHSQPPHAGTEERTDASIIRLTPEEFCQRWEARVPLDKGQRLEGLCGRFTRGSQPEHFEMLSDEPGKKLSWVCSSQQLGALLGKTPCEAMISIGFRADWLAARQMDGTKHMLVLFPADNASVATWNNIWVLIKKTYGPEVDAALKPFRSQIEQLETWSLENTTGNGYATFDPAGELQRISDLPVVEKYEHPGFLTADRFLAVDSKTLYHARGFLDHSVGCNARFTGTGLSPDGEVETLVPCVPVKELVGLVQVPLAISDVEIQAHQRKEK